MNQPKHSLFSIQNSPFKRSAPMIAKPTQKTIPIAILLILIVALLGWLYEKNTSPPNASPPAQAPSKNSES